MTTAQPLKRRHFTFQVRSGLGDDPTEILTHLTHQVWRSFEESGAGRALDPHLWPEIFKAFRSVFSRRLSYNPQCGHFEYCMDVPCVLCGQSGHTHPSLKRVYLLETRQPLDRFLRGLSAVVTRRLRRKGVAAERGGKTLRAALQACVRDALKGHFFISDLCQVCPVRETLADRRIWAHEQFEAPWGSWRDIFPEEVTQGLVLE